MNIEEKAKEYAHNKMQQVLNDAVAEASTRKVTSRDMKTVKLKCHKK